jgi:lipopolysaccharide transport system permease protein/teichoic acid transport system permease protein
MEFIKSAFGFGIILWQKKSMILELARRDFISEHSGTLLGVFWNYAQPLIFVLLLTLVFTVGLRQNPGNGVPFLVFLISGIIAWQLFSQTWGDLTRIINAHAFLVRKGDFPLAILPLAKMLSDLIPHLVLIVVSVLIAWFKGIPPTLYTLQVFYYLTGLLCLLLGLGWLTSAISLFIKDVSNFVGILTQFGFWITPIFWNTDLVPPKFLWLFKLNPAFYFVSGYRDSLIYGIGFWEKPFQALYFWTVTLAILIIGATVFRRLKPHFGEVV